MTVHVGKGSHDPNCPACLEKEAMLQDNPNCPRCGFILETDTEIDQELCWDCWLDLFPDPTPEDEYMYVLVVSTPDGEFNYTYREEPSENECKRVADGYPWELKFANPMKPSVFADGKA